MADETPTVVSSSFLDEDLGSVDTSMPVIKGGLTVELEVTSVSEEPNKDNSGNNLVIKTRTVKELPSTKGPMINAGFPLTKYISLTPVEGRADKKDYRKEDIRKNLAQFLEAVEGKKGVLNPTERFKGMHVLAKITVSPGNSQFPNESNSLSFVRKG